jgi:hypothetical protein
VQRATHSWLTLPLLLGALACGQGPSHPAAAGMMPVAADDNDDSLNLGVDGSAEAAACVGVEAEAVPLPVDLFAVVDRSGSMGDATLTGVSKWYATKMAFHDFLEHAPPGMRFGLSLFPVPGATPSCATNYYREQALPIADVEGRIRGAEERFDAAPPEGSTPTAPALTAALELAQSYALAHVDRSVVVVLATDGLPTSCSPTDTAALAKLAQAALEGPAHVRTLVVASRSLDEMDLSGLEQIAAAGGTARSLVIDPRADFAKQLRGALSAAAARDVACDLALPEPPTGSHLDYDAVNVVVEGADGRVVLPRVAGPAACTSNGGWYYDIDPAKGAPSRLDMCKSSCERAGAQANAARALRVELGCKSLVR